MGRAQELLPKINVYLALVSAVCALITLSLITWGRIYATRGEMNRVSIRLTQGMVLVIIFKASVMLLFMFSTHGGIVCTGLSFIVHWLSLVYIFFGVSIAANLHCVALRGARPNPFREALCWILPLLAATVLMGSSLIAGRLGLDNDTLSCEFRNRKSTSTHVWIWISFLVWILVSGLYCSYIVLKVLFGQGLAVAFDPVEYEKKSTDTNLCALISDLKTLVHGIAFYCFIPVITQTGFFINTAYGLLYNDSNLLLVYISVIGTGLSGILTLAAFLKDPSLRGLIRSQQHKRCAGTPYSNFTHRPLSKSSLSNTSLDWTPPTTYTSVLSWGNKINYLRKSLPPLPCCQGIPPHPLTPSCRTCPDDIKLFVQNL
ncbi:hypothetical protein DSO57_1005687 [Entomophthora muscae]|uniref:Uncharacterized protein n=1 Tax=Entomophthora muscae TaxID=34485 RepID=A0ACC2TVN7_9FUNG|nr:hypothetical protein DSO57_1005687 [Entomophthora muscae]